jgi:membrane peptidoglycan carboxypeptidase
MLSALLLALSLAAPATAAEGFASYPPLPTGYSSIRVFDSQGRFVGRILPDKRYWVSIERIPDFLQRAVVAVEDARFYEHGGIDVRGIARAMVKNVVKRRLAEGARPLPSS